MNLSSMESLEPEALLSLLLRHPGISMEFRRKLLKLVEQFGSVDRSTESYLRCLNLFKLTGRPKVKDTEELKFIGTGGKAESYITIRSKHGRTLPRKTQTEAMQDSEPIDLSEVLDIE